MEECSGAWRDAERVLKMVTGNTERHGDTKGAKWECRGVQNRNVIEKCVEQICQGGGTEQECHGRVWRGMEQECPRGRAQKRNVTEWHMGVWNWC